MKVSRRIGALAVLAFGLSGRLLGQAPVITSASPNPLPAGIFTITIHGSGVLKGARVLDGGVQLTTLTVNATSIRAKGYQVPAASATFCVRNPGTACSNSLAVPVNAPRRRTTLGRDDRAWQPARQDGRRLPLYNLAYLSREGPTAGSRDQLGRRRSPVWTNSCASKKGADEIPFRVPID